MAEKKTFLSDKATAGILIAGGIAGAGFVLWKLYESQRQKEAGKAPLGPISIPVAGQAKPPKKRRAAKQV